jgi:hypothetical protein
MALADYRQNIRFGIPGLGKAADWLYEHSPAGMVSGALGVASPSEIAEDPAGALLDPITGQKQKEEALDDAEEQLKKTQEQAEQTYAQSMGLLQGSREQIADIIGPENVEAYKAMVAGIEPTEYTAQPGRLMRFEFERDPSKYLDPSAKYQIDQSVNAALQAMSGQGGLQGGAAARALQAEASAKAGELYGDAWERMMKSTEQEYGREQDVQTARQVAAQQASDREKFKSEQLGNLYGSYVGNLQGGAEDIVNLLMAQMQTNAALSQAMAQLGIDRASMPTTVQQGLAMAGRAAQIANAVK